MKELTIKAIESIVDTKHILKRHQDTYNKDLVYTFETVLNHIYGLLLIEGYSKNHLTKVIYSESFEYKGVKY